MPKEEASSPEVAIENLLLKRVTDSRENFIIVTLNAPNTFAQKELRESK